MYDTYTRYIYEWLTNTFYPKWQNEIGSILSKLDTVLTKLDSIFTVVQWGLYLGIFVFFFWVLWSILKPHLFKV